MKRSYFLTQATRDRVIPFSLLFMELAIVIAGFCLNVSAVSADDSHWLYDAPALASIVSRSNLIVIGYPEEEWLEWPPERTVNTTVWRVRVERILYRECSIDSGISEITVFSPGGLDSTNGQVSGFIIPHAARLFKGRRSLLFLTTVYEHLISKESEHMHVVGGMWGTGVLEGDTCSGGAVSGKSVNEVEELISVIGHKKDPAYMYSVADGVVRCKVGSTSSTNKGNVSRTVAIVQKWLKGSGSSRIVIEQPARIDMNTKWDDRVVLQEGAIVFLFLRRDESVWRVLGGPDGNFGIDGDGKLFAYVGSPNVIRYLGMNEREFLRKIQRSPVGGVQ